MSSEKTQQLRNNIDTLVNKKNELRESQTVLKGITSLVREGVDVEHAASSGKLTSEEAKVIEKYGGPVKVASDMAESTKEEMRNDDNSVPGETDERSIEKQREDASAAGDKSLGSKQVNSSPESNKLEKKKKKNAKLTKLEKLLLKEEKEQAKTLKKLEGKLSRLKKKEKKEKTWFRKKGQKRVAGENGSVASAQDGSVQGSSVRDVSLLDESVMDDSVDGSSKQASIQDGLVRDASDAAVQDAPVQDGSVAQGTSIQDGSVAQGTSIQDGSVTQGTSIQDGSVVQDTSTQDVSVVQDISIQDGSAVQDTSAQEASELLDTSTQDASKVQNTSVPDGSVVQNASIQDSTVEIVQNSSIQDGSLAAVQNGSVQEGGGIFSLKLNDTSGRDVTDKSVNSEISDYLQEDKKLIFLQKLSLDLEQYRNDDCSDNNSSSIPSQDATYHMVSQKTNSDKSQGGNDEETISENTSKKSRESQKKCNDDAKAASTSSALNDDVSTIQSTCGVSSASPTDASTQNTGGEPAVFDLIWWSKEQCAIEVIGVQDKFYHEREENDTENKTTDDTTLTDGTVRTDDSDVKFDFSEQKLKKLGDALVEEAQIYYDEMPRKWRHLKAMNYNQVTGVLRDAEKVTKEMRESGPLKVLKRMMKKDDEERRKELANDFKK